MSLYEAMFLLDNQVVREDWKRAKGILTGMLEKHGAKVLTARRWDERKLTYPIAKRRRATFLLAYYEQGREGQAELVRDLELSETVLRHLILRVDAVPEAEHELARAEDAADFSVPPPPTDDVEDEEPAAGAAREEDEEEDLRPSRRGRRDEELVEVDAVAEEE